MQAAKDRFDRWDSYGRRTHPFDPKLSDTNVGFQEANSVRDDIGASGAISVSTNAQDFSGCLHDETNPSFERENPPPVVLHADDEPAALRRFVV